MREEPSSLQLILTAEQIQEVQNILKQHVPEYAVWAFGSRVTGNAKPFSDLDLAILSDKPLTLKQWGGLQNAFSASDLPFKVDLVDWATTAPSFRERIRQHHLAVA